MDLAKGQSLCLFPLGLETRLGQTQGEGEEDRGLRPGKAECGQPYMVSLSRKFRELEARPLSESWGQIN